MTGADVLDPPVTLTKKGERYCAEAEDPGEAREAPPAARVVYTLTERMEAGVERLERLAEEIIGMLDRLQTDPDLEDDEREAVSEDEGADTGDDELSLGRSESVDQSAPEPGQDDLEPSLGSIGSYGVNQIYWAAGDPSGLALDCEEQCEDEGGACEDEGAFDEREPDTDDEGHGQAVCIQFIEDGKRIWPPAGTGVADRVR